MMPLLAFFVAATAAWTAASLYLSFRQAAFVRAHRDSVPADFSAAITPDEHRHAADYAIAREELARVETLVDTVVTLGWAFGGIALVYGWLAAVPMPSLLRGLTFLVATSVVSTLIGLPFGIYRAFGLEKRFGFNRTTPATFVIDRVKRLVIGAAVGAPLVLALLWTMGTLSGLWWLYAWVALLALMLVAPTLYVRLVAPRFNRFTPLADDHLRARIDGLLTRSGFQSSGLYTMDASRRTAHGNAYFIGFGRTKRIVLFDTLLARSTPDEIEAVVAHELGHFLHRHVLFGLLRSAVILFAVLAVFGWLTRQPWLLPQFGLAGVHDDAVALFVCSMLASILGPLLAPLGNWISRKNEYQADDYARRTVGVDPMVGALTRLARDNASTLTPDPLYAMVHHSHPTVPLRVRHLRETAREAMPSPVAT